MITVGYIKAVLEMAIRPLFQSFIKTPAFIIMCCSSCFTEANVFVCLSCLLNSSILASENDVNDMMGTDWDRDNINDILDNFSDMEFDRL